MIKKLLSDQYARERQYLYKVALALLVLGLGYNIISPDRAPEWAGLVVALFAIGATSTADRAVNKQIAERTPSHRKDDDA